MIDGDLAFLNQSLKFSFLRKIAMAVDMHQSALDSKKVDVRYDSSNCT